MTEPVHLKEGTDMIVSILIFHHYGAAEFVTTPVDFDFLKAQLQPLPAG
jgi:hypothetical protein